MNYLESKVISEDYEYDGNFWNYMKGKSDTPDILNRTRQSDTGAYALPKAMNTKAEKAIVKESAFRKLATVIDCYNTSSKITKATNDSTAEFVAENGSIPVVDVKNDFSQMDVLRNKIGAILRLPTEFVYDASFDLETYLANRIGKAFGKAEDKAYILGNGTSEPTGILDATAGAEVGLYSAALCADDITDMFFSLDKEYRDNATWIMNDETALYLRKTKDDSGNYLWNHSNDTIYGKPVVICNDMPNADPGEKPIAFGDFSYYWILRRSPLSIKALKELYALKGLEGYLAIEFLDGKLIGRDAVKLLQISEE